MAELRPILIAASSEPTLAHSTADSAAPHDAIVVTSDQPAAASSFFSSLLGMMNSNSSNAANGGNTSTPPGGVSSLLSNEEVQGFLGQMKSRRWMATLRAPQSFFSPAVFSKPRTTAEAMARVEANVPFFLTNYLVLVVVATVLTIITRPSLILIGALLGAMWHFGTRQETLVLGGVVLQGRPRVLAFASVTAVVLFLFAGTTIFALLGFCAVLVLGHAMLHNLPLLEESEMSEFGDNPQLSPA